jgi:hypothetical protein
MEDAMSEPVDKSVAMERGITPGSHYGVRSFWEDSAMTPFWLWGALLCGLTTIAYAEVQVEGSLAAVRITTDQATISDVLAAVTKTFNIKSHIPVPLEAAASASYAGSFRQVTSRLLDGYDYVIKREQGSIEVVVLGKHGEFSIASPPPPDFRPPMMSVEMMGGR